MCVPNRAKPQHRHVHGGMMRRDQEVRNIVVSIRHALDRSLVHPVLRGERRKRSTGCYGLAHNHVTPRNRHPIGADSDFDGLNIDHSAGYVRADLGGWYSINSRVTAYANVANALDRRYNEVVGFPALPINFRAGFRFRIGGE